MAVVIIAGSRSVTDYGIVKRAITQGLYALKINLEDISLTVSGNAPGVDRLGEKWTNENNLYCKSFPASGPPPAQFIRNEEMAKYAATFIGNALIAILGPGKSNGTRHMIKMGMKYGLPIYVEQIGKGSWLFTPQVTVAENNDVRPPKPAKRRILLEE